MSTPTPPGWQRPAEFVVWAFSLLGPFVYSPPASPLELSLDRPDLPYEAARVLLTVVVILVYYLIGRKLVHPGAWAMITLGTLLLGGGLALRYHEQLTLWTIDYNGGLVVRGDELTDTAKLRAVENQLSLDPIDHTRLFFLAGGEARDVWKDIPVIHARWREFVLLYFGAVVSFTLMLIGALQLGALAKRKKSGG